MRIEKLTVHNFLGLRELEIELAPKLTLFYGDNGQGKTSVADAIRFALSGRSVRGYNVPELIHFGEKSGDVELEASGEGGKAVITRVLDMKGAERFLDGVEVKVDELAVEIRRRLGVDERTVDAALRAGALLELKADELQRFLCDLVGASLDGEAIARAFGEDVVAAAARLELALPSSLEEFPRVAGQAETIRKEAKRAVAAAKADLERVPRAGGSELGEKAFATFKAWIEQAEGEDVRVAFRDGTLPGRLELERELGDVRAKALEAAKTAGRAEGTLMSLRARKLELEAKVADKPKGASSVESTLAGLESSHANDLRAAGELRAKVDAAKARAQKAAALAGDAPSEKGAAAKAKAAFDQAKAAADKGRAELGKLRTDGVNLKADLEAASAEGCTHGCPIHCPDVAKIERKLKIARDDYAKAAAAQKELDQAQAAAEADLAAVEAREAAAERDEANAESLKLELELRELEKRSTACEDELAKLRELEKRVKAWKQAQAELAALEKELEAATASDGAADVEALGARTKELEAALGDFDALVARYQAEQARQRAEARVKDSDTVAVECGPRGSTKSKVLAKVLGPFLEAANAALAELATGYRVAFQTEGELALVVWKGDARIPVSAISPGERVRLLYVLQFAVSRLAKVGVVILDDAQAMDDAGRANAKKLVARFNAEGGQVLMLTCAPAPKDCSKLPAGVVAYRVADGRIELLGGRS